MQVCTQTKRSLTIKHRSASLR